MLGNTQKWLRKSGGQFLFILTAALSLFGQNLTARTLEDGWRALDRGDFAAALATADATRNTARSEARTLDALLLSASTKLVAYRFSEAERIAQTALERITASGNSVKDREAEFLFIAAEACRKQRRLDDAIKLLHKARKANDGAKKSEGIFALRMAQIFVSKGFDVAALIWLERAEKNLAGVPQAVRYLHEVYRFQVFALNAKFQTAAALDVSRRLVTMTADTRFQYVHRNALYVHGNLLSSLGYSSSAIKTFETGLEIAVSANDRELARSILTTIGLNYLSGNDVKNASDALARLNKLGFTADQFAETELIQAVILGLSGKAEQSRAAFEALSRKESSNSYQAIAWQAIIAERRRNYDELLRLLPELQRRSESSNQRDELVFVESLYATALNGLGRREDARIHAENAVRLAEELRKLSGKLMSLDILNAYHRGFRLIADLEQTDIYRAFALSEQLKARSLRDIINGFADRRTEFLTGAQEELFGELSDDVGFKSENEPALRAAEAEFSRRVPTADFFAEGNYDPRTVAELRDYSVVSYFFSNDGKLSAFLWDTDSGLRRVPLNLDAKTAFELAQTARENIRNRVFFKRDGVRIYDALLRPLGKLKDKIIIIPDGALWMIPFQALSVDGQKYLIEEHVISYAPSLGLLINQLSQRHAKRSRAAVFANQTFGQKSLKFVNPEALGVAELLGVRPVMGATRRQFLGGIKDADIIHLSMHAEAGRERALDGFLGFRQTPDDDGKLTVEDLLSTEFKRGSLVFIASCDTNQVHAAEGLVGLAWGAMVAGATTVVSANWEADDRSTREFSTEFYRAQRAGASPAEALQTAAKSLISNKYKQLHEPYFWATFALTGDFR